LGKAGDVGAPTVRYGTVELSVAPEQVVETVRALRDDPELACEYFGCLSAIDWMEEGFEVFVILTSLRHGPSVCVKVRLPAGDHPHMPTLTGVFRGADWHERETHEMFGIHFDGHHNLVKLYLPEDFEGHPLLKSFALASRVFKPWPGEKEFEKE
jgi:NADH-quinone oxidoreductase subunit C